MKKQTESKKAWGRKNIIQLWIVAALAVACCAALVVSVVQIVAALNTYSQADREYDNLRENYKPAVSAGYDAPQSLAAASSAEPAPPLSLSEINSDYIGWITIPDTRVDYPMVQGSDNVRYLTTSFEGSYNAAGAIFMEVANTEVFASRHAVLYGHNMNNGAMFGELAQYADAAWLADHSRIDIVTADNQVLTYRVFAARKTDVWDAAYRVAFADDADFTAFAAALGAPAGVPRMLTLSTCTTGGADEERYLVHAALEA
ncbi:MAG TPA: hypothetical protein DEB31_02710 [Clostridiales bacterium]|nr:hypothetical protein [Clostridiales bacterium]